MAAIRLLCLGSAALVSACGVVGSARQAVFGGSGGEPQPTCADAVFPEDQFIGPAFTDKFTGRYWNGTRHTDVWRQNRRMFVGTPGGPTRQLQRASDTPGEGLFRDGCGARYHFILPPDGPGGMLRMVAPDGTRSEWHRRAG